MNDAQLSLISISAEQANATAGAVIRRHSRSFSIASRLLPARVRASVYGLYAWCRTVDDAVDNAASLEAAERILNVLEDDLDRIRRGEAAHHAASIWIKPLLVERRIVVTHAKDLIAGMRMDLQSFRVTDDKDLHRYCYHAAGTVGLMMTRLMGVQDPAADRHAVALGVAMQMTNIARDVREDAERGRSYLPGVDSPLAVNPHAVQVAVADLIAKAESHYKVASEGLRYLPWDCRFAIRMALSLYREIGRQIERNDCQVLHARTVVSKLRLLSVMAVTFARTVNEEFKIALNSITQTSLKKTMNDTRPTQFSTVAQAKHVVYLGLSLTAIMAAALFMMVFMNPKDASYSFLPLVYSGASLFGAIVFNRLAARCETSTPATAS